MPTPSPIPAQIEEVRELSRVSSYSEIEARINLLSDAGWAATINDLTEYSAVKNDFENIKIDGVEINPERTKLAICNRVRVRLGLSEINENGDLLSGSARMNSDGSSSSNVETVAVW